MAGRRPAPGHRGARLLLAGHPRRGAWFEPLAEGMSGHPRQLRRSTVNRQIAGVCAGIAEYFELDPTTVRVVYVLVSIFSAAFPGLLIYVLLWILIPERDYY